MDDSNEQKNNSDLHWQKTKDKLIFNSMKSPLAFLGAIGWGGVYFWVAWPNDQSMAFYLGIQGLFIGFGTGMAISILINVIRIIFIQKGVNKREFVEMLVELTAISEQEASRYYDDNEGFIQKSYARGLDTFGAIWHISNASMERICAAHDINDPSLIEDIPDFTLLTSLQVANMMAGTMSDDELNANNKYWNAVLKLKIDPKKSDQTYSDRLHELVEEYKKKRS